MEELIIVELLEIQNTSLDRIITVIHIILLLDKTFYLKEKIKTKFQITLKTFLQIYLKTLIQLNKNTRPSL
jgi:hypothetical protein